MVARDNGTTYNGLASYCTPVSRLAAVSSGCPTTAFADCDQVNTHHRRTSCVGPESASKASKQPDDSPDCDEETSVI